MHLAPLQLFCKLQVSLGGFTNADKSGLLSVFASVSADERVCFGCRFQSQRVQSLCTILTDRGGCLRSY